MEQVSAGFFVQETKVKGLYFLNKSKIILMINGKNLDYFKSLKLYDAKIENLKDIKSVKIDTKRPTTERVLLFMAQIGNPYLFKVGDVPVKVIFNDNGPTLQQCLEIFSSKNF